MRSARNSSKHLSIDVCPVFRQSHEADAVPVDELAVIAEYPDADTDGYFKVDFESVWMMIHI